MISKTSTAAFERYAELRKQKEELELEIEAAEQKVLKAMDKEQMDTIVEPFGTFSKVYRTRWEFDSPEYNEYKETAKALKKAAEETEIEKGRAEKVESVGLSFRKPAEE